MSFDDRFSEQEKFLLTSTPSSIGSAMAFAEGSGLGTVKELMASVKSTLSAVKDYPNNEIITNILPNLEDRKEAMAEAKAFREKAMARYKEMNIDSHEKLRDQILADCREVSRILDEKASDTEKQEYKEWTMSLAEKVAYAAKEGGFLGFGGERVSQGEREMFASIAQALGTSSRLA